MKIAVLGMGLMGRAIALRLTETGHDVIGWSRSEGSVEYARSAGVTCDPDLQAVLDHATTVITVLSDYAAIESTLLDHPQADNLHQRNVIQMATISPSQSMDLDRAICRLGGSYLEAPMLGSTPQAREGSLIIMCGGDPVNFKRYQDLLGELGKEVHLVGRTGQGAAMKLAMNQLIAMLTTAFSQSLGYIRQNLVDEALFMQLLRASALYAPTFDKKLPNMQSGQYASANFPLKHLLKDQQLFCDSYLSRQPSICRSIRGMLEDGVKDGKGNLDYSAIYELLNEPD